MLMISLVLLLDDNFHDNMIDNEYVTDIDDDDDDDEREYEEIVRMI